MVMDKAIIFEPFEFVSFAFCTKFLNKGMKVIGIQSEHSLVDFYLSEKRLEIGRNANFKEFKAKDWLHDPSTFHNHLVVISLYDSYMSNDSRHITDVLNMLHQLYEDDVFNQFTIQLIILMPILFYSIENKDDKNKINWINHIINMDKQNDILGRSKIQYFYLPTIYGPWQPENYLFHQALKQHLLQTDCNSIHLSNKEYIHDAIYIDDVVKEILYLNETSGSYKYLIQNKSENNWKHCAGILLDNLNDYIECQSQYKMDIASDILVKQVQQVTPTVVGLEKQKKQMTHLLTKIRHY